MQLFKRKFMDQVYLSDLASRTTALIISNEEIGNIMKIVKSLVRIRIASKRD